MRGVLFAVSLLFFLHQISATDNTTTSIPLSMMKSSGMLDAMKTGESYARYLFNDYSNMNPNRNRVVEKPIVYRPGNNLLGSESLQNVERSEIQAMLQHAGCQPYEQVVALANSRPDVIMYPSCVLLKQCGGCCGHPALACRASSVKEKVVPVTKYVYDGTSMFPEEMVDYVNVQEHTACECMCKVQESDCNPSLHKFDANECQCKCKNTAQSGSCPDNKRWNDDICACQCSSTINCGTGYKFNVNTCVCDESTERGGDLPIQSNNRPQTNSPTPPEVVICGHLRCPRRYKPALRATGGCRCVYARRNN